MACPIPQMAGCSIPVRGSAVPPTTPVAMVTGLWVSTGGSVRRMVTGLVAHHSVSPPPAITMDTDIVTTKHDWDHCYYCTQSDIVTNIIISGS